MADPTFIPPAAVGEAAALGLELRQRFGRGGTRIGAGRGTQLSNRERVSLDIVRRMSSYFARHAVDAKAPGWADEDAPSAGWIAWLLWGGDPGRAWVKQILADVEKDQEEGGSICVAAMLPPALASQFPAQAAPDVDQQMPPHITVLYAQMDRARLALAERIVRDAVGNAPPIQARVGGLGHFDHDDQSVAWAGVDAPGLADLREHLLQSLRACGIGADQDHPSYTPHATISYLPPGGRWSGAVPAGRFTIGVLSIWIMGGPSSFCMLGQPDDTIDEWPEDMAKSERPTSTSKFAVQPHVRPDIHFAGHHVGGLAVKEVEKALRDLEEKAKDLAPEDQEKLAKALEDSAGKVRKAKKPVEPDGDEEAMKTRKAKEDEEKRLAKAKQDEEAQKAKDEADAEAAKKAKRDAQEKAAGCWPMDMAR